MSHYMQGSIYHMGCRVNLHPLTRLDYTSWIKTTGRSRFYGVEQTANPKLQHTNNLRLHRHIPI
jgi:hypothetical protein